MPAHRGHAPEDQQPVGTSVADRGRSLERIMFVCTANICRSPMAQVLMQAELGSRQPQAEVVSAGLLKAGHPADRKVVWALSKLGLDVTGHVSAVVSGALQQKPDLILTMAREHLRAIATLDSTMTARAFTLKEFVQLADLEGPRRRGEALDQYLKRVSVSRSVGAFTSPGTDLDVEDPIGKRKGAFARCASELQFLVRRAANLLYPAAE